VIKFYQVLAKSDNPRLSYWYQLVFRESICAPSARYRFVSKPKRFKCDYIRKSRPNFGLLTPLPPVKLRKR